MVVMPVPEKRQKKPSMQIKYYEIVIIFIAIVIMVDQAVALIHVQSLQGISWKDMLWGLVMGSQMLVTKALRVPIAPGKWMDFTYVPIWVLAFTLHTSYALPIVIFFSIFIYIIYPQHFSCRKTSWSYLFHLSYQTILFFVTIESFWLVKDHWQVWVGNLSLTATIGMFASMFGLMFTDTLLGGLIQVLEGQKYVFKEWANDYWRITALQTLLSSIAMLFAVQYESGHPIQFGVVYSFFLLAVVLMYRASFRQDDYMSIMRSMINVVELKDTYTKNHSESVGHYSVIIGQMLGFSYSRLQSLYIAAQLHDVGKIGIPDEILKKQGLLTDEEYQVMKTHAKSGEKVLEPIHSLQNEAHIVGRHHEYVNGKGYPYEITHHQIPLESRIISIADSYHAMISHRPYRRGLGTHEAMNRLIEGKGSQFDPLLVDLFCEYIKAPARHTYRFRPFCLIH